MDYQALRKLSGVAEPAVSLCPFDPHLPDDPVPLADLYSIVGETLSLGPLGFHEESVGRWTREVDGDISHVLYVHRETDAEYELTWGVDLVRMPRSRRRTPDLFEGVRDYVLTSHHELDRIRSYRISSVHGCGYVIHDVKRVWRLLRPIVFAWWEGAMTLDEIADRAHRQARRNWIDVAHDPDPATVETFIRTGRGT